MNQAQEITSLLPSASSAIHTEILLMLRREEIEKHCKTLLETKGFNKLGLITELAAIITKNANADIDQIIEFLKECTQSGFYTSSMLLSEEKFNLLDNSIITTSKHLNILQNILPSLIKWSGKKGGKTDDGQGERALILLTKGAKRPSEKNGSGGDIDFGDCSLEIKGSSSRLTNASNPTVETLKSGVKYFLRNQGENPSDADFETDARFSYHINNKGITKLNQDVLQNGWRVKEYITNLMTVAFPKISPNIIKKRIKKVIKNNQIDWKSFVGLWTGVEFIHYHHTSNHYGLAFINPNTLNYKYIRDAEALVESVSSGEIHLGTSLNLHSGRESTMQYSLK